MLLCSEPQCANYQICLRFFQPSVWKKETSGREEEEDDDNRDFICTWTWTFFCWCLFGKSFFLTCKRIFFFLTAEWCDGSNTELFWDFSGLRPLVTEPSRTGRRRRRSGHMEKSNMWPISKKKNNLVLLEALHTDRAHQKFHTLTWRLSGFSVLQWDQLNVLNNDSEQFKEPWSSLMRLQLHKSGHNKMSINQCHSLKGTRLNVSHLHLRY